MDGNVLNPRGFSLVELAIAMGIIAILSAAVVPVAVRGIEIKAAERTISEVGIIQAAAKRFYAERKAWPLDLAQMQALGYLSPLWSLKNPWGNAYQMSSGAKTFTVSTSVPGNLVAMLASRVVQSSVLGTTVNSTIGASTGDAVDPGVIVAWSGAIADIPQGWALCDGTNGTPDLRDKFIVGARQDVGGSAQTNIGGALAQSGGTVSHSHGGQTATHALTVAEMPSHTHDVSLGGAGSAPWTKVAANGWDGQALGVQAAAARPSGGGQGHAHAVTADLHLPPFYALAFIMKL